MFVCFIYLFILCFLINSPPVFSAHAVAWVETSNGVMVYHNTNQKNKKTAGQNVKKYCSKQAKVDKHIGKCKFLGSADGPAYLAIFFTKDGKNFGVESHANRQEAINEAYANCSKHGECLKTAASVRFDEGQPQKIAVASGKNCRPRTRIISCRSKCINGDCIIEYENGCKIGVQVSPRFDSFSNQWTYSSPPC